VSLGRIDARFLLPFVPDRVAVLPGAEGWRDPLAAAGVEADAADPQVVVAGSHDLEPEGLDAQALIVEGRGATPPPGYAARRFVALPALEDPSLLVPLDSANAASYALDTWLFPSTVLRGLRKKAAALLPLQALRLLRRPGLMVATRQCSQPFFVAAALDRLRLDGKVDWFVVCGRGDALSRGLFVLFRHRAREPSWVVKFARVRGYSEPFNREEAGLQHAVAAGGAAARRAPRLLGRVEVDGYEASVETAAVGMRLAGMLQAHGSRQKKLLAVEAVVAWLVEVARETRGAAGSASAEIDRLRREVLPHWPEVDVQVLSDLDRLAGVLQHNDLGAWNILAGRAGAFTVVDWESARACGLPLWDLWYFLAHTLVLVDARDSDPVDAFARLFRGELPSSALLFRWTRTAAAAAGVAPDLVGRLATLCWLHHGLSRSRRAEALEIHAPTAKAVTWPAARFARAWLSDPALGTTWSGAQEAGSW
jgi:hypothetical protein